MNIDNQAREAAATERRHQKLRDSSLEERGKEEIQARHPDGVSESAREHTAHERHQTKKRQSSMQQRANEHPSAEAE